MYIQSASINRWSSGSKPSGSITLTMPSGSITMTLSDELIETIERLAIAEYQTTLKQQIEATLDKPVLTYGQEQAAKALSHQSDVGEDAVFEACAPSIPGVGEEILP